MAQISVKLSADIRSLERALKAAERRFKQFEEAAEKAREEAEKPTKDPFKKTTKGAANATNVLTNFGRVVQDAPFGIQGVANNIDQLGESLTRFIKDSGGGAKALKAIGSAILSPSGLLVAVSAITSAFIAFGPEIKDFILQTSEAEKAQKEFNKALNEGIGAAQGELAVLDSLVSVARNESASKQERLRAIRKINDQYGEYLPNLNLENVNTQKVTTALDKYSTALIRNAKIKGAQSLISEKFAEILELEQSSAIDNVGALDVIATAFTTVGQAGQQSADLVTRGFKNQGEAITEAEKRIESLRKVIQSLITEDLGAGGIFTSSLGGGAGSRPGAVGINSPTSGIAAIGQNIAQQIQAADLPGKIAVPLNQIQLLWAQTATAINDIGQNSLVQGIQSTFAGVGRAIADGANIFAAFGAGIIGAFGNFLSQFGQQLISYGVAALAFSNVSKGLLNPITAGPSAIAAIAIGAALSTAGAALSSIGSRGLGGNSGGSGNFTAGGGTFTGASSSVSSGGGFGGTVVFEIQGTKLVGVLNRTLKKDRRSVADII